MARKRKKCKCTDIKSCTAYLRRAYKTSRSSKARAAMRREASMSSLYNG